MKTVKKLLNSPLLPAFISCFIIFSSCASAPEKAASPRHAGGLNTPVEIMPANDLQAQVDVEIRPVIVASFGGAKIASVVSSDNIDAGIGGWLNYAVPPAIDQNKAKSFEKRLKDDGFVIAQNVVSVEAGRLVFNMIAIKETPAADYNLNIGTLQDEENEISVFVTVEKKDGAAAPAK